MKKRIELDEDYSFKNLFKEKRYKNKAVLISVGYHFRCRCGKIRISKDNGKAYMLDVFGGIARTSWICDGCGNICSIDFNIKSEKRNH